MGKKPNQAVADLRAINVSLQLAVAGLALIILGNAFQATIMNVDLDALVANLGALLLVVGLLQWLFDTNVRQDFTSKLREDIIGSKRISDSGISDYFIDSKLVVFDEQFLSSTHVTIGVNYSSKLVDNAIELLKRRTADKRSTTIVLVKEGGSAFDFLNKDFNSPGISAHISKIQSISRDLDPTGDYIMIKFVDTILRYSFVLFDSRAWIIIATNGKGRRAVPGFYVSKGGSWFEHFHDDIQRLIEVAS